MPSAVGYQPTLAEEMGNACKNVLLLQKRVRLRRFQAVYVPADDLTDPFSCNHIFAHLDATRSYCHVK